MWVSAWELRAPHVWVIGVEGIQGQVEVFAWATEAGAAAPGRVALCPRLAVAFCACASRGRAQHPSAFLLSTAGGRHSSGMRRIHPGMSGNMLL